MFVLNGIDIFCSKRRLIEPPMCIYIVSENMFGVNRFYFWVSLYIYIYLCSHGGSIEPPMCVLIDTKSLICIFICVCTL